jgi:hypothetical protein
VRKIGGGGTVLFWKDFWQGSELLCDRLPRLFSYTLNEDAIVADIANSLNLTDLFALPLSVQAPEDLNSVQTITQNLISDQADLDNIIFP